MKFSTTLMALGAFALAAPVAASVQPDGKGKPAKAERGNGNGNGNAKANRGNGNGNANRGGPPARVERAQRGNGNGNGNGQARQVEKRLEQAARGNGRSIERDIRRDIDRTVDRYTDRDYDVNRYRYGSSGSFDCPSGLAKKNNGCLPPGQAKQIYGQQVPARYADNDLFGPYRDWYRDDDDYRYRLGDDFIYRLGAGGVVSGLIPLFDRRGYVYPVGSQYPDAYDFYNVPRQYRSAYDNDYYRYGDGAIYRIDPETQVIRAVAALLTGDLSVGQALPSAYSAYNVPYGYRNDYRDSRDNYYRYSDGYIYRVDPTTRIITELVKAVI